MNRFELPRQQDRVSHAVRLALASTLSAVSGQVWAAASASPAATSLAQLVLGLILVLALIAGGAWLLKRYGQMPGAGHAGLRVLGGVSLGPRERALLLQLGDKQLLVGVAPGCVQTLLVLEQPAAACAPAEHGSAAKATQAGFSARLASWLRTGSAP